MYDEPWGPNCQLTEMALTRPISVLPTFSIRICTRRSDTATDHRVELEIYEICKGLSHVTSQTGPQRDADRQRGCRGPVTFTLPKSSPRGGHRPAALGHVSRLPTLRRSEAALRALPR